MCEPSCIVSGLNTRYSVKVQGFMKRIHDGAVGDVVTMHAVRCAPMRCGLGRVSLA